MTGFVGRLSILLDANIARFESDLGRAERIARKQSAAMQRSFESAATKIGAAFGGAFALVKITGFVKSVIDANDVLGKLSQKVGVSSETLSALGIEARKAGVDVGATQSAFVKLAQAATDSSGKGAKALAAMGISAKQFLALKPEQQFDLVARKFASYEDGARKAALATVLFGKTGADLIPLLNKVGSEGLDNITQKAIAAGTAVGGDAVAAASKFNDALADLKDRLQGAVSQGLAQFTPYIEKLSGLINTPEFQDNLKAVANGVAQIGTAAIEAANKLVEFTRGYAEFVAKMQHGAGSFDLPGMQNERDNIAAELAQRARHPIASRINSFLAGSENNIIQNAVEGGRPRIQSMSTKDLQARAEQLDRDILHARVAAHANTPNPQAGDMRGLFVGLGGNQAPIVDTGAGAGNAAAKLKAIAAAYDALAVAAQKANEKQLTPQGKALADYTNGMRELAKLAGDYVAKGGDVAKIQDLLLQGKAGLWDQYTRAKQAATAADKEFSDGLKHQLDLQKQAIDIEVASIGMGQKAADRMRQRIALEQQGADAIRQLTLERDKYLSTDPQYQVLTQHIKEQADANAKAVDQLADGFKRQDAGMANWRNGFNSALDDFSDRMKNTAQQAKDFTNGLIDGFSNAFSEFATHAQSASKAFGGFIDQMLADAYRWLANKAIQAILDSFGGGSSQTPGSTQGGFGSILGNFANALFGGGKAVGGGVSAGTMYQVNERGPELLSVGGRDFLMMGNQGGSITPNSRLGGGSQVINVNVQPTSSQRTASQIAQAVARKQQLAMARA